MEPLTIPSKPVNLSDLIQDLSLPESTQLPRTAVTGIEFDSRRVKAGDLFVALTGGNMDGHSYIPAAVAQGAAAVVGTQPVQGLSVPYIRVSDSRLALAQLSSGFYGHPSRRLVVIGVTGTDGKTTTSNLIYQILLSAGIQAGMVTSVNARIGDEELDTGFHVTTPEAPDVQRYLARMVERGLTHVVLEATSHGLAQQRVAACNFDLGVVTNITHEHLDYHGGPQEYREAKALLFTGLGETVQKGCGNFRIAVLNRDDSSYSYLLSKIESLNAGSSARISTVSYGLHPQADVRAEAVLYGSNGMQFEAVGPGFRLPVVSRLVGEYNLFNCLAAIALAVTGLKLDLEAVREGIASLQGIPGRMERIDLGQDFTAIVDFAHTPNAMQQALRAARKMTSGRVIAVFGSAGLRDRLKRRMMAETSVELADLTVLTAEDPRTESLDAILAEMAAGAASRGGVEGVNFWRVADRGGAIRFALTLARPGDLVIALGKGHEQSMCFGEVEYPWDDRTAMRAALAEHLGLAGPQMPYLPTADEK